MRKLLMVVLATMACARSAEQIRHAKPDVVLEWSQFEDEFLANENGPAALVDRYEGQLIQLSGVVSGQPGRQPSRGVVAGNAHVVFGLDSGRTDRGIVRCVSHKEDATAADRLRPGDPVKVRCRLGGLAPDVRMAVFIDCVLVP